MNIAGAPSASTPIILVLGDNLLKTVIIPEIKPVASTDGPAGLKVYVNVSSKKLKEGMYLTGSIYSGGFENAVFHVHSASGAIVRSFIPTGFPYTMNTQGLTPGFYIIESVNPLGQTTTARFVIQ